MPFGLAFAEVKTAKKDELVWHWKPSPWKKGRLCGMVKGGVLVVKEKCREREEGEVLSKLAEVADAEFS